LSREIHPHTRPRRAPPTAFLDLYWLHRRCSRGVNQATFFGLGGNVLLVVVVPLLFAEEAGVPLFFAPGDLLLGVGGVAIASGQLSPFAFVPSAYVALNAGALVGWELFSRLGWDRLLRIARRFHADRVVDRAATLLQDAGWRAVFISRLIPGLRIYTTQVAAVSRMPRRPFLVGLMAANVVYVAAFVGLGEAVGRPVINLIDRGEAQAGIVILIAVLAVATFLLLRSRAQRVLVTLELHDWRGAFLKMPSPASLALIPLAIGLDYSGHALVVVAHLPLFLDSIGTILVAMIAGPWVGGFAGLLTNLVSAGTIDPIAAPYCVVSLGIGLVAGLAAQRDWRRLVRSVAVLWGSSFLVAVILSTPLNLLINNGRTGVSLADSLIASLTAGHLPLPAAAFIGEAAIDLPDKLITVVAAVLPAQTLSGRYRATRAPAGAVHTAPAGALPR
jgi:energy-coupling factor transport system substrate-specific component